MVSHARAELAATQLALAKALLDEGPVPPGFDAARVLSLKASLSHKRARAAAQAWPSLQRLLGPLFSTRFAEVVAVQPLAADHGPMLDGLRLAEKVEAEGELDGPTAAALASVRLRYQVQPGALVARGRLFARARSKQGVAVAVRLGVLGHRVFWIRRR